MQKSRQQFVMTIFPLALLGEFWFCLLMQIAQEALTNQFLASIRQIENILLV